MLHRPFLKSLPFASALFLLFAPAANQSPGLWGRPSPAPYVRAYKMPFSQADRFYARHGGAHRFSPLARKALDVYLWAEDYYKQGRFRTSKAILDRFWHEHPPGGKSWDTGYTGAKGVNVGQPVAYYGLRMLTECVDYRVRSGRRRANEKQTAQLTVLVPAFSRGIQPRTKDELIRKTGVLKTNRINKRITRDNFAVVHQMAWLFAEYMNVVTGGKLNARIHVHYMPQMVVPVHFFSSSYGGTRLEFAGLKGEAFGKLWQAVPETLRHKTDWWWLIHPSHFPESRPVLRNIPFITGGMGSFPGGAPLFISDDLSHVRKRPFHGGTAFTSVEYRTYFSQWMQHEFFHHIFARYPEFGLEKNGHDWGNRRNWPRDFRGRFEADYYYEALHKRILPRGRPGPAVKLRYARTAQINFFRKLRPGDLVGTYRRRPVRNSWHTGTITVAGDHGNGVVLKWRNQAGVTWKLYPRLDKGRLDTGPDNPYARNPAARSFLLEPDQSNPNKPRLRGFRFQGELYIKD